VSTNKVNSNQEDVQTVDDWLRARAAFITQPVAEGLTRLNMHPNTLTIAGFVLNLAAGLIAASGRVVGAGIVMLLASCMDGFDGALARTSGKQSRFGAFLDSSLDRLSEGAVLLGLLWWAMGQGQMLMAELLGLILLGSVMVSYTRARAEGVGYACKAGLLTRPLRVALLGLGMLTPWLLSDLVVMAVLTWFTVAQRLAHVYAVSRQET